MGSESTAKSGKARVSDDTGPFDTTHMVEAAALQGIDPWSVSGVLLLSRVARVWEQALEAVLKEHGLIPAEMRVLSALLSRRGQVLTMGGIRHSVAVTAGGVTKAVARLEALDLVRRTPDESDGRITNASITDKGISAAQQALRDVIAHFEGAFGSCNAMERDAMSVALKVIVSRLPAGR